MSEKTPSRTPEVQRSGERLVNKPELILFPRPVSMPAGMTLESAVAAMRIKTPAVEDGVATDMNEAFIAASGTPPTEEMVHLEFIIAPASGSDYAYIASDDTDSPWRPASPLELLLFTEQYSESLTESPLVALGQIADNHYPLAVTKTGDKQLELRTNFSGLTQIGTKILLVRTCAADGGSVDEEVKDSPEAVDVGARIFEIIASSGVFEVRQAKCIALVESLSPKQKDELFDSLAQKLTVRDREALEEVISMGPSSLLGESGRHIQDIIGDDAFEKIIRYFSLVRLKNEPKELANSELGFGYELTDEQLRTILRMIPAELHSEQLLDLLRQPDTLNSEAMNTREHARIVFSCVNSIFEYFKPDRDNRDNTLVSDDRFEEMTRERDKINRLIGIINGVNFRPIK